MNKKIQVAFVVIINILILVISLTFSILINRFFLILLLGNAPILMTFSLRLYSWIQFSLNFKNSKDYYDKKILKQHIKKVAECLLNKNNGNINYHGKFGTGKTFFAVKLLKYYLKFKYGFNVIYKNMWWGKNPKFNFSSPSINGNFFGMSFDISRFTVIKVIYFLCYIILEIFSLIIWHLIKFLGFDKYETIVIIDEPNKEEINHSFINKFLENKQRTILISNSEILFFKDKLFHYEIEHLPSFYGNSNLRWIKMNFDDEQIKINDILKKTGFDNNDIPKDIKIYLKNKHLINQQIKSEYKRILKITDCLDQKYGLKNGKPVNGEDKEELAKIPNYSKEKSYYEQIIKNQQEQDHYEINQIYIFELLSNNIQEDWEVKNITGSKKPKIEENMKNLSLLNLYNLNSFELKELERINDDILISSLKRLFKKNKKLVLYFFANIKSHPLEPKKYTPSFLKKDIWKYEAEFNGWTIYDPNIKYYMEKLTKEWIERLANQLNEGDITYTAFFLNKLLPPYNLADKPGETAKKKIENISILLKNIKIPKSNKNSSLDEKRAIKSIEINKKEKRAIKNEEWIQSLFLKTS